MFQSTRLTGERPNSSEPEVPPTSLATLLAQRSRARPGETMFRGGEAGRQRSDAATSNRMVEGLAGRLASLRLPGGSPIAIAMGVGPDAPQAILAAGRAGLTPCLVPVAAGDADLDAMLDACGAAAVVTQTRIGDLRPAETMCRLAAGRFGLRFVLAFGDDPPEGVIMLRPDMPEAAPGLRNPGAVVTFAKSGTGPIALIRNDLSLVAAASTVIRTARIRPGDVIATALAQDDLKGLGTGLVAALAAGAALETGEHLFAPHLLTFDPTERVHLVLPGWAAPIVAAHDLQARAASIILVDDADQPDPISPVAIRGGRVVDVLALGEVICLASLRSTDGLAEPSRRRLASLPGDRLTRVRIVGDRVEASGIATEARRYRRPADPGSGGWRDAGAIATF